MIVVNTLIIFMIFVNTFFRIAMYLILVVYLLSVCNYITQDIVAVVVFELNLIFHVTKIHKCIFSEILRIIIFMIL